MVAASCWREDSGMVALRAMCTARRKRRPLRVARRCGAPHRRFQTAPKESGLVVLCKRGVCVAAGWLL